MNLNFLSSQLFLKLPPETAHHTVIHLLKSWQWAQMKFLPKTKVRKETAIQGVGLAAGFDKNAEVFLALSWLGFNFIEVGTVTPRPQVGNAQPRLFRHPGKSIVNRMGFNNVGIDQFVENIKRYRPYLKNTALLANIGKNKDTENALDDYKLCVEKLENWVDGFIINVSSPNTPGLRDLQSVEFISSLSSLKTKQRVWIKLAPDLALEEFKTLCLHIQKLDFIYGLVLTNTSIELAKEIGHEGLGGYSGPKLFSKSLFFVETAHKLLPGKHIIGVGGISTPDHVKMMQTAGASACEIYTSFIYEGPRILSRLKR